MPPVFCTSIQFTSCLSCARVTPGRGDPMEGPEIEAKLRSRPDAERRLGTECAKRSENHDGKGHSVDFNCLMVWSWSTPTLQGAAHILRPRKATPTWLSVFREPPDAVQGKICVHRLTSFLGRSWAWKLGVLGCAGRCCRQEDVRSHLCSERSRLCPHKHGLTSLPNRSLCSVSTDLHFYLVSGDQSGPLPPL